MEVEAAVEPHAVAPRPPRSHEPEFAEETEGPVHRIERDRRHSRPDTAQHGLCVRMIQAAGHLAEDLDALGCNANAGASQGRTESIHALRKFSCRKAMLRVSRP
jgi:hypothetical protein